MCVPKSWQLALNTFVTNKPKQPETADTLCASEGVHVDLGAARTHFVIADLANFVASQCSHGSLLLASAAVFDLQTKKKRKKD